MKPETSQNIQKVKLHILNKKQSAFISSMLYNLKIEATNIDKIQLHTSEEKNAILINEDWFNQHQLAEQASILVHEVLHYSLQHDLRLGQRDPEIYQKACDQIVNNLLMDMEYELPNYEKNFTKPKYHNMAVEAVYKDIEQEQQDNKNQNQNNNSGSGFGSDLVFQSGSTAQQNQRTQQVLSADMSQQAQSNKSIGSDGSVFEQFFKDIKEGKLDWRTILAQYVDEISQNEMSYINFNRRYLPLDLYLPDTKGENTIERIALAFDVSGSVTEPETKAFLAEMRKIKNQINPEVMSVTTFNHQIVEQFNITKDKDLAQVTMKISGGTNLEPVFKYYNETKNNPLFLIVFSDMELYLPKKPKYPVIWICINNPDWKAPYGKIIHITSEDLTKGIK